MVIYCCVPFCKSQSRKSIVFFHKFPSEETLRIQWITNISRKGPRTSFEEEEIQDEPSSELQASSHTVEEVTVEKKTSGPTVLFHPVEDIAMVEDPSGVRRISFHHRPSLEPRVPLHSNGETEPVEISSGENFGARRISFHPRFSLVKTSSSIPLCTPKKREKDQITKIPRPCVSPRTILAIMGFFCFFVFSTLRLNIAIAIVSMVNWSAVTKVQEKKMICHYDEKSDAKNLQANISYNMGLVFFAFMIQGLQRLCCTGFPRKPNLLKLRTQTKHKGGEFAWDPEMQGYILSSYYIGLAATQFLGGRLAEKYSAKKVLLYGTLLSTICTLLTPEAARLNVYSLIVLQIIKGAGQGIMVPAFSVLVGNWVPVPERTSFMAWISSGLPFGAFFSILVSGYICQLPSIGGWPSVFYFCGLIGATWCVLWSFLIYDSPTEHPWVAKTELIRFMSIRTQQAIQLTPPIPIKEMAKSLPAWSYVFVGFASFWTISLFSLVIPIFMGTILRFPIEINGIMSSLPNLAMAIFMICSSLLCRFLQRKRYATVATIHKTTLTIGLAGFCICMISLVFVGCSRFLNVFLLTMALGITGINLPTIMVLPVNLTPKFAGTLSGFQSTFGSLSGLAIPIIIGFLTEEDEVMKEWYIMFYLSGAICLVSVAFFLIFGESEVQPWNYQLRNPVLIKTSG